MTDELIRNEQRSWTPWESRGVFAPVHGFCEYKELLDDAFAGVCTEFHMALDRALITVPYVVLAHFEGVISMGDRHCTVIPFCSKRGVPRLGESRLTSAVFVQVLKQKRLGIHVRATEDTLKGPPGFNNSKGAAAISWNQIKARIPNP